MATNKGFTLLELIVSVVIITIIAGTVSPNFLKFKNEFDLNSAYNILAGDLKLIQNLSMNNSEMYLMGEYQKVSYAIEIIDGNTYRKIITDEDGNFLRQYDESVSLSKNNSIIMEGREEFTDLKYIRFRNNGKPDFLDSVKNIIEYKGGQKLFVVSAKARFEKSIEFNTLTGKIKYERE